MACAELEKEELEGTERPLWVFDKNKIKEQTTETLRW